MSEQIPEIFRYEHPVLPDDCFKLISPSLIYKFFTVPKVWFEEVMLGKKDFMGNEGSITGTICHYIFEKLAKGENVVKEEINKQLHDYLAIMNLSDVKEDNIIKDYRAVANQVVNEYVLPHTTGYGKIELEKQVYTKIPSNFDEPNSAIYIAGTVDRIEGDCVVDYKNVGTKPNETEIPFNYKIQLLAYAYILRSLGYEINRIRIVYGVKPLKTIGARCIVVTEQIGFQEEQMIEDTLRLMADTIMFSKQNPQYNYMLFKSYALKEG